MKIAIILHSQTGNTQKFANSLFDRLCADGHTVNLTKLETTVPIKGGSVRQAMDIKFRNLPRVEEADVLLLGGPVWAFGPSPVIVEAIKQLGDLNGKLVLSFVTMGLPLKGMGGKAALAWMERTAGKQGAKMLPGSICCQMFHDLDRQIAAETKRIAALMMTD